MLVFGKEVSEEKLANGVKFRKFVVVGGPDVIRGGAYCSPRAW
jgi:hypothetical protein